MRLARIGGGGSAKPIVLLRGLLITAEENPECWSDGPYVRVTLKLRWPSKKEPAHEMAFAYAGKPDWSYPEVRQRVRGPDDRER